VTTIHVLPIVAFSLVLCLTGGCGGHGGRNFARVLRGVVTVTDFRVAAGERVGADGDVTVQCQTAEVEGELVSLASTGSGVNGGSITIEAQGDIVVTGRIEAGAGTDGSSTGVGGNGGAGGSVALKSSAGSVTLGVTAVVAGARPRQAGGGASLRSGDGGNGGNGTFGGAGGNGGDITIECPTGTWHITPGPNLLVFGNGGNGGNGTVPTAQLEGLTVPETLPNGGGDSGRLTGNVGAVEGVTLTDATDPDTGEPIKWAELPEDALGGWEGGDAGKATFGDESETARSRGLTPLATREVGAVEVRGSFGGDGGRRGGNGCDVFYTARGLATSGVGTEVIAYGGYGGNADTREREMARVGSAWLKVTSSAPTYGGRGGDASALAGPGADGGPSQDGAKGGKAEAYGGDGGKSYNLARTHCFTGRGGHAYARGGDGGAGGHGSATQRGGKGGAGGGASAFGGDAGFSQDKEVQGAGGNATAVGGQGGRGGDGNPPGSGAGCEPTVALAGLGTPTGTQTEIDPERGGDGTLILPPTTGRRYSVIAVAKGCTYPQILRNWWEYVRPSSVHTAELTAPAPVLPGESLYMSADLSHLWLATTQHAHRLDNPLGGGVGSALFTCDGDVAGPLWVDEGRDVLYCAPMAGSKIHVWPNASTAPLYSSSDPARTIVLAGAQIFGLTGDATANRLYVRVSDGSQQSIAVLDNASGLNGAVTPGAVMTGLGASDGSMTGLAYARQQDVLYLGRPQAIGIVTAASTRTGPVALRLVQGAATGIVNEPVSLDVFGDDDVLIVGDVDGAVLAFTNASTLVGNVAFAKQDSPIRALVTIVAWPEPAAAAAWVPRQR